MVTLATSSIVDARTNVYGWPVMVESTCCMRWPGWSRQLSRRYKLSKRCTLTFSLKVCAGMFLITLMTIRTFEQRCDLELHDKFEMSLAPSEWFNRSVKNLLLLGSEVQCHGALELLAIIPSHATNSVKRHVLRKTWITYLSKQLGANFKHVFLLGKPLNETYMDFLTKESQTHHDLVMYNMLDTYLNLTVKTLSMLHWIHHKCNSSQSILKIDDDVYLNPKILWQFLGGSVPKREDNVVTGFIHHQVAPIRDPCSKWFTSLKEYPQANFPDFAAGPLYIMSGGVAESAFSQCTNLPFFHLEDVFLWGFCGSLMKTSLNHRSDVRIHPLYFNTPCLVNSFLAYHDVGPEDMELYWDTLVQVENDPTHCSGLSPLAQKSLTNLIDYIIR